jgi:catechol 2,3-dioxygenase-like lactoylglutathione lyase family enzyme
MLAESRVEATVPTTDVGRAREFYEGTLGLPYRGSMGPADMLFECGGGSRLVVYERGSTGDPEHTLVHFIVDDVAATVAGLRERGVRFEEYDLPEIRTVDGIASAGDHHIAWFKDPDGNVLGVHD